MDIKFETARLTVHEVFANLAETEKQSLLKRVVELFSPAVVEHLPPAFQQVNSLAAAETWFSTMLTDSRMFSVTEKQSDLIAGLVFVSVDAQNQAHIGYLLAEDYWGRGLASELLTAFIELAAKETAWSVLIGGVDQTNAASARLLKKLGFIESPESDSSVVYYRYDL